MNNRKYWRGRFENLQISSINKSVSFNNKLKKEYDQAFRQTEKDIENWYLRLAKNNNVSLNEAKKMLNKNELEEFKWTVEEYIKYATDNNFGEWTKALENASAKVHINRLEAINLQIEHNVQRLFNKQPASIMRHLKDIYSDDYYKTIFNVQTGFNVGYAFNRIDEDALSIIMSNPWSIDGKLFSDRIYLNKKALVDSLQKNLLHQILRGDSPDKAIKSIAKQFDISKRKAGRLIMTESAYVSAMARKEAYAELEVEQFEIIATLDSSTSETCQDLDGQIFDIADYEVGKTANPFHPNCRSTTAPYYEDNEGERLAKDRYGKSYSVPSDMKYKDWKKKYIDESAPSDLTTKKEKGIIKAEKDIIQDLEKLKNSGIAKDDYKEYLSHINNHDNSSIRRIYSKYGDKIGNIKKSSAGGHYSPSSASIEFSYPTYKDMNKYDTLTHEYAHFFDSKVDFKNLNFNEIKAVQKATGLDRTFANVGSSSDEFLEAVRKDRKHIKNIFTTEAKADLLANNSSSGVQDAIDGMFSKSRISWGHGETYYNSKYRTVEKVNKTKDLQKVYKELGVDASNQSKVKLICREYTAGLEIWANIMSAEVCGGKTLEYVKKYLPNSYQAMIEILKEVE